MSSLQYAVSALAHPRVDLLVVPGGFARVSFKDELVALLKKNRIEFDERYLLD